jgi:hypothetical protein
VGYVGGGSERQDGVGLGARRSTYPICIFSFTCEIITVQPLSATPIPDLTPNNTYTTDTRTPFDTYITHLRKLFSRKDDNIIKIPPEKPDPGDTRLQVAVAIVFPSEKCEEDSLEYCIGVKEVLCREE